MLPKYRQIEHPLLAELLRRGGRSAPSDRDANGRSVYDALADYFALSDEDRAVTIPGANGRGERSKWQNMVQFARRAQVDAGNIDNSTRGVWALTPAGVRAAEAFLAEEVGAPSRASDTSPVSPQDLLDAQQRDRETGRAGELFVLLFERTRLIAAGRDDLAQRVAHVAENDVSAGYDVQSFDPTTGGEIFIEVKATRLPGLTRFFLTDHEREVAKRLGSAYFIYEVASATSHPIIVNLIRDPEAAITSGRLNARPVAWVITHVASGSPDGE
jgi:hypothetical protein